MKKLTFATILIVLLTVITSCSSVKPYATANEQNIVNKGVNKVDRPEWVFQDLSNNKTHYVVGYGKMSSLQNSIKRAQTEAKNLIAEWVSTSVDEVITTYTNDSGNAENGYALDAFEVVSKQRAQAILSGVEQVDLWEDADGGVWILMSIPVENVKSQMFGAWEEATASATNSLTNKEAAKEANDKMAEAINAYFN